MPRTPRYDRSQLHHPPVWDNRADRRRAEPPQKSSMTPLGRELRKMIEGIARLPRAEASYLVDPGAPPPRSNPTRIRRHRRAGR